MTEQQAVQYLAGRSSVKGTETGTWQGYAVALDCRVIGEVGMFLQLDGRTADLGFVLHPDFQGQGFATEAARALVEYGFRELGLLTITGHCDRTNLKSAAVLERIGMHRQTSQEGLGYAVTPDKGLTEEPISTRHPQ